MTSIARVPYISGSTTSITTSPPPMESTIKSASHHTTNRVIFNLITERLDPTGRALDFGAGKGHMSERVGRWFDQQGQPPAERLSACEVTPEVFEYAGVPCKKMGLNTVV